MNASDRFLEQALDELEVLRKENEVLKRKLSKACSLFKEIKRQKKLKESGEKYLEILNLKIFKL